MGWRRYTWLIGAGGLALGCGSAREFQATIDTNEDADIPELTPPPDQPSVQFDFDSGGNSADAGAGDTDAGSANDNCSNAAKPVYVFSKSMDLYRLDPLPQKTFTKIGPLQCSPPSGANASKWQGWSMAVSREAVGYFLFTDLTNGYLFSKDLAKSNSACVAVPFNHPDWNVMGMGFASTPAHSDQETFFVSDTTYRLFNQATHPADSRGIGRIDFTATPAKVVSIGQDSSSSPLYHQGAELTGNFDGELYGFYTTSPPDLALIDRTTGKTQTPQALSGVQIGDAWAMAFWGGDFYLFTAPHTATFDAHSRVQRYSNGQIDTSYTVADIGFQIVGAGVSTCAPMSPPSSSSDAGADSGPDSGGSGPH